MKKRLCSLLLVLTMLSTLLVAPASALEADGSTSAGSETYVYLGVKDYGTVEADSKPDFVHRFYTNGKEVEYTIASDDKYAVQNKLQEGYVYDLTIEDGVVTDAAAATADAEGTIKEINATRVTFEDDTSAPYFHIYEISNTAAGATAVAAVTDLTALAGKTAKVYGDTVYLTFIAEPYTAPVHGTPGVRTLKNYLQTAMNPVGTALYVYGGSWDWQDVNSSNQALTIGLPQTWVDFFQQHTSNYTYKYIDPTTGYSYNPNSYYSNPGRFNQYYYGGPDCSGYIGWVIYNVMNTESSTNDKNNGYVMYADEQAQRFANDYGWGSFTKDFTAKDFKPGDIFSMDDGHVWTVIGTCSDGSIVFSHSTPSDSKTGNPGGGVQLSALNPSTPGSTDCDAYRLATKYMQKYYPEWSERYDAVLKDYDSYTEVTKDDSCWGGKFSWALDGTGLTDPNGYADMSAAEILADLFGEVDGSYENAVYLGVKNYGTVSTKNPGKDNFIHRFFADGKVVEFKVANDGRYSIQNTLQEGYVYDLTVENSVVTTASTAKAAAEGEITEMSTSTVTIGGKEYPYTAMYQIDNAEAGATAVTVASYPVGKTAKVYDGTVYLTFIAKPYTAPVSGKAGERTLKNYLKTALEPVGTTLYVYGAGWDWQDDLSSNQSMTIGLSQSWIDFFQQQDANYTYKNSADHAHSYYPHNSWNQYYYAGLDCSGYVGWVVYNVMHTQNSVNTDNDGYVMSSTKMAKTFADKGWGTWTRDIKSFKPGDIFSMSGHVWTVLGVCDDGSIVFLHSTPSDSKAGQGGGGVQLSALNPNSDDDKNCEAYKLVTKYMTKYYPEWSDRYDPVLRSYISYATPATGTEYKETWSGNFSWNLDGTGLSDPEGYADKSAAEILADLFGEPMPTTCENAVYLGIKGYGTKAADGDYMERDAFTHLFSVNGKTMEFTLANDDGKYAIQNKLQEGYVYDLSTQGSVVTDANLAAATAEGEITEMSTSTVTIGGKEYPYTAMYQIDNAEAGATAVTVASYPVGKTAKVYDGTVYLTFIAKPYTAPVSGKAGERTLKNYLKTALEPVGTTLYVYGAGWDWQDDLSSNQSMTIGLSQSWIDFFQQQDANYTYKNSADHAHSYYPHNSWNQYYYAGLDCSGYVGWVVYNVMHTQNSVNTDNDGYVMSSTKMAKTFADKGWGTWTRDIKSFKPGDIFSMSGHVWTVLGVCDDGSIVFLHSTPSDSKAGQGGGGVQLSALNPNSDDDKNCEAYKLVTKYMTKYYPEWSTRYDAVLRSYDSYATPASGSTFKDTWSGNFSWNLDGTGLTDPDGYANMSAAEILADLFGENTEQPSVPVIPSQPSTPVRPSQPSQPEQPSQKGFNDVKPGDYFYDAVNWAVEKGITTGTSATTFSPNASCTRAQIVTFLWRASGSPEPKTASNPFTDVAANAYYCKAVLWAVENGITTGTSATTFSPDAPCTRAQGVTFLWRANGSKAASAAASFTDVASDAYYAPAVAWAAEQNVTGGVGNGLFSPDTTCTRAQIVSMLYRLR